MRRRRGNRSLFPKILLILVAVLAVLGGLYYFLFLSRPGSPEELKAKPESAVRLGSVNVNGFRTLSSYSLTAEFLLKMTKEYGLDILLVQEFHSGYKFGKTEFKKMFSQTYPHIIIEGEQCIASKYPILSHRQVDFKDSPDSYAVNTILYAPGDTVTVISAHLQTTGLSHFGIGKEEKNSTDASLMADTYSKNAKVRVAQAEAVSAEIESSRYPVIVAGDFNAVPLSKVYFLVKGKKLKDAFMEKGKGKGSTFRPLSDLLRIDYIMHGPEWNCLDFKVASDYISDHRMVFSTFSK